MKKNLLKFLLVITIISFHNVVYSQANEIKIKFIGNCGLYMTDGVTNFYIDFPYKSGAHNYMEYDKSELDAVKDNSIFIFTHRHADHYSEKLLKKMKGQKFDPFNVTELRTIEKIVPNFEIKSFETQHKVFGISFKHFSYLITWHGKNIYISGDTEKSDTIASQKDIDWAFVPVWILTDAKANGTDLTKISKMFAIYHIGQKDKITINDNSPQLKLLDKQGEVITIPY